MVREKFFYIDIRENHLSEFPKNGQKYYYIFFEDLNIRVGITVFETDITSELYKKDFTINTLCYDIIDCKLVQNRLTQKAI